MKNKTKNKIFSLITIVSLLSSVIIPTLSMPAFATAGYKIVDESASVYITDYTIDNTPSEVKKGEVVTITVNVVDNRVSHTGALLADFTVALSGGSFSDGTSTVTQINDVGTIGTKGDKILGYKIKFENVKYSGDDKNLSFNVLFRDSAVGSSAPILPAKDFVVEITQAVIPAPTPSPSPSPTPSPSPDPTPAPFTIDSSKAVYVSNYVVLDKAGNEISKIHPGDTVDIALSVVDNRITYYVNPPQEIRARLTQGAFVTPDTGNVSYKIRTVGNENGRAILGYSIVFYDVKYQGGAAELSFDVSYPDAGGVPLSVPYTLLKQNITQASDDVPEPKVILNSANYGAAAIIGQNFTLSTTATNTAENVDLSNVSVRIELPKGLSMASGNSQVLIGNVPKKGTISHAFSLVVSGVENEVTSLPVKLVYEFEAYVKGQRKNYISEQTVTINIEQPMKFDISKFEFMETVNVGEEAYITIGLVNKGKTTASNVTAEVKSEQVSGSQVVFVGNVQPGSEGSADVYFPVNAQGTIKGKVVITYENSKGIASTIEKDFSMEAMESFIEPMPEKPIEVAEETKGLGIIFWVVGAVVLIGAGVAGFFLYKKYKLAKEAEDEDEDI